MRGETIYIAPKRRAHSGTSARTSNTTDIATDSGRSASCIFRCSSSPSDTTQTVWRSGLAPYAGTPSAAQLATDPDRAAARRRLQLRRRAGRRAVRADRRPATRDSFSHIHFYHEQPLCAANWYVEHLGMELPPVRDSSGKESPRPPWNPCDVKYGEAGWPSLEPIGHDSPAVRARVRFANGSMSWYPRQCVGTRCGRDQKLVPSRGQVLDHVAFSVDNFDALFGKLARDGVKVLEPPHAFGDTRAFMIEDPDGLAIEIMARKDRVEG